MTDSIQLIKAIQAQKEARRREEQDKQLSVAARRGAAMEPLFELLRDLEKHFIPISVMRRIWPHDWDQRDDRVASLVVGYLTEEGIRCGVKLKTLTGTKTFSTEIRSTGELSFIYTNESAGFRPETLEFGNQDRWLNLFLHVMAEVIDPSLSP